MTFVALLGQPLRADYCLAFLEGHPDLECVIVTSSGVSLQDHPDGSGVRVIGRDALAELAEVGEPQDYVERLRLRFVAWTRSGSKLGLTAGRVARSVQRLLRRFSFSQPPRPGPNIDHGANQDFPAAKQRLIEVLEVIDRDDPIESLVVFDLFDLPGAIEFAETRGIEVSVR